MVHTTSKRLQSTGRRSGRYPELEERRRMKVIKVSGDLRLASMKARKRLGSEMSLEQRRAQIKYDLWASAERRKELRKRLGIILAKLPTAEQLLIPTTILGPVPEKALEILGDDLLKELSLRQLPLGAKITPKVLKIFGTEPTLMSPKARSLMIGGPENLIDEPRRVIKRRRLSNGSFVQQKFMRFSEFVLA